MGTVAVPNTSAGSWDPIPRPGLPCPAVTQEEVLSLLVTFYTMVC